MQYYGFLANNIYSFPLNDPNRNIYISIETKNGHNVNVDVSKGLENSLVTTKLCPFV